MKRFLLVLAACGFSPQPAAPADDLVLTDLVTPPPSPPSPPPDDGPSLSSLSVDVAQITAGESVHIVATVVAPGPVSGSLHDPTGTIDYGAFSGGDGSYRIDLSWAQLDAAQAINFTDQETRSLRAVFFDLAGRSALRSIDLILDCNGLSACNGTCVNLSQDQDNCGACGKQVPLPLVCAGGLAACPSPNQVWCAGDGICADLSSSTSDCGVCGNALGSGASCVAGRPRCDSPGQSFCPSTASCVLLDNDTYNCGSCDHRCADAGTSLTRCNASECQYQRVTNEQVSCDTLCARGGLTCVDAVELYSFESTAISCGALPRLGSLHVTCWCQ